jgi:hypothetical protein
MALMLLAKKCRECRQGKLENRVLTMVTGLETSYNSSGNAIFYAEMINCPGLKIVYFNKRNIYIYCYK